MKNNPISRMPLEVIFGGETIKAFVVAPKRFNALGIVRRGMEYGILVLAEDGSYLRVNGSVERKLIAVEVENAIRRAISRRVATPQEPTVVFRKRRHADWAPCSSGSHVPWQSDEAQYLREQHIPLA